MMKLAICQNLQHPASTISYLAYVCTVRSLSLKD